MTFAGYPAADRSAHDIAIVGAPCDLGATGQPGQRFAPESIRVSSEYDHAHFVDPLGFDYAKAKVQDHGDIPMVVGDYTQSLVDIETELDRMWRSKLFKRLIVLGGDDGINAPVAGAMMNHFRDEVIVIHLDAHTDTYLPQSDGRRDHGTWVADLIRDGIASHVHQYGQRAVESRTRRQYSLAKSITRHEDVYKLIEAARHPTHDQPILLVVDMDVLDPAFAPGVAFPEPGGLMTREVRHIVRQVARYASVFTVTEVTPALDPLGLTSQLANRLVLDYVFGAGAVTSST